MSLMTVSSDSADILIPLTYSRAPVSTVSGRRSNSGHPEDAVHRSSDLVAHVGQKLALVTADFLGLIEQPLNFLLLLIDHGFLVLRAQFFRGERVGPLKDGFFERAALGHQAARLAPPGQAGQHDKRENHAAR